MIDRSEILLDADERTARADWLFRIQTLQLDSYIHVL